MQNNIELSIVAPVYNEEKGIVEFVSQLEAVLVTLNLTFEVILVDDGSRDNSYAHIENLAQTKKWLRGLALSRNYGHQSALLAGLYHAKGAMTIMMDSDLQHPVTLIPELIAAHKRGYEIVNTFRINTEDASLFKKATSNLFYKVFNMLSETPLSLGMADFRLLGRKSLNALLQMPEKERFTRGMISWLGFKNTKIEYTALKRFAGTSSYSFKKMLKFASSGLISFSAKPLHLSFLLGLFIFCIFFAYGVYVVVQYHIDPSSISRGWSSLFLTLLFSSSTQLITLGIIGEYISKIYSETKQRPTFIIENDTAHDDQ
jgi:glycosyltransferase involved in cell wall biosynthesis